MVADGLQAIDPLIKMLGERRQAPPSTLEGDQAANAVNSISEILANLRQPSPRGSFP